MKAGRRELDSAQERGLIAHPESVEEQGCGRLLQLAGPPTLPGPFQHAASSRVSPGPEARAFYQRRSQSSKMLKYEAAQGGTQVPPAVATVPLSDIGLTSD